MTTSISPVCKKRLQVQGYDKYTDNELNDFKYGIRFAYAMCITVVATGLYFQSVYVLAFAALVAFAAVFPPYHPFDYLYNYGVRYLLKKPVLPHRTSQGRFACGIATVWLGATLYFLVINNMIAFYLFGCSLIAVGALVAFLDICIPSMIYNAFFKKRTILSD